VDADRTSAIGAAWIKFIDELRLSMSIIAALTQRLNVDGTGINAAAPLFNHARQP
jgi:hypothetical protein